MVRVSSFRLSLAISLVLTTGCATVGPGPSPFTEVGAEPRMIPAALPRPVKTIEVWDAAQKKRAEADVLSLTASQIRTRLTSYDTFITIEKSDTSGKLTYLGAGAKVARGSYKVTFDYVNYTDEPLSFDDGTKKNALGRLAVGVRITADLETTDNGVDLGGLIPLGVAVQQNKARGHLGFHVYGMSNDKVPVAAPSQSILDISAIQKAFETAVQVRVLFNLDETHLEPYLIGVAEVSGTDAPKALDAAKQLTK